MNKTKFTLVQAARKQGGDRYEAHVAGEVKPFVIYVPQSISRVNDLKVPMAHLYITIEKEA